MVSWLLSRFVLVTATLALLAYITVYQFPDAPPPIRSDAVSYYVYLPSWLLHGDISLGAVARDQYGGVYPAFTAILRWPATGRWVNAHPIGVAVLMSPFFTAAHLLTRWSNLPPNGFSTYYQHFAGLSGLVAGLVGLGLLRGYLSRHFSDGVVLATLVALTWGTNLFHYMTADSTFSHAFSFMLIAALLALTDAWWTRPLRPTSLLLGLTAGVIVLVRHPNILFLAVVPLYAVTNGATFAANLREIWKRRASVLQIAAVASLVVLPQLALYRYATGHWFVSAYGQIGGFTFASPHLREVLVGVQKGLFFWSPILLMAVAGFFVAGERLNRWRVGAALVFCTQTYIIASWWDWQFGGSFGHRGFTDGLPFAALFLAGFFAWASGRPRVSAGVGVCAALCVSLSVAQMLQYWMGIMSIADITWEQYRELFLRFE